jgi:hypothetical protein
MSTQMSTQMSATMPNRKANQPDKQDQQNTKRENTKNANAKSANAKSEQCLAPIAAASGRSAKRQGQRHDEKDQTKKIIRYGYILDQNIPLRHTRPARSMDYTGRIHLPLKPNV